MFRQVVMAAASSSKGKVVKLEQIKPPVNKMKAQIRSVNSKSSPVYKLNADASLVNGMRNLSLRSQTSNQPQNRRKFCIGSGKITIKHLSDVASVIREQQVKNIVVVAGAGISTPSGIPDFRTPETGLYDNIAQYNIPYPEAIFDIDYFHQTPRPFFALAKELYPSGKYRPNYIHYFARLLHDKGQLLRMYTQNIDGLERLAGIPPSKLVEAHGTFATATCVSCGQRYNGEDIKDKIFDDKIPRCKRSGCLGVVKPDIVFFGEELPKRFYYYLKDMIQTDLVLVMGTSLEVYPFAGIIDNVRWNVPRVLFNRNAVGPFSHHKRTKDFLAEGDLLETVQKFVNMMEWKDEMAQLITKCEGEFKIVSAPPTIWKRDPPKASVQNDSSLSNWRQKAKIDLFKGTFTFSSSSSEVSSSSESDDSSSSSSSSEEESKKKKINGHKYSNNNGGTKTNAPSKKFSTSTGQQNGAAVNPRMLKPLHGQWVKNGSKQADSSSNREPSTKLRPPLGKLSKQKSFSEQEGSLKHSESNNALLERETAFIVESSSSITSKTNALKINREKSLSDSDRNFCSNKKPFVRPLSDSPAVKPSQTQMRSRLLLNRAKLDIDGKPSSHQKQGTLPVVADSKKTGMKSVQATRTYSRIRSAEMPRLRCRQKQGQISCDARIQSTTGAAASSGSSSEVSDSGEDSR
ncbi:uncharacterized protein LOC121382349 [Gigantopelta aegis]|uniref:uncharacterized protein LOC121382349 n=1 Tax=Gigantopelta aegis TaxID=1735272 RepID=UPI001B88D6C1|nr:uncharacterized protein LOC121382349 [Gigantopelta aegis]